MATLECTQAEFNKGLCDFIAVAGSTASTQDEVALAFKFIVLSYLGCKFESDEKMERSATMLMVATNGAIRRGWHLIAPDLSAAQQGGDQ